jgi:hypothetical protein
MINPLQASCNTLVLPNRSRSSPTDASASNPRTRTRSGEPLLSTLMVVTMLMTMVMVTFMMAMVVTTRDWLTQRSTSHPRSTSNLLGLSNSSSRTLVVVVMMVVVVLAGMVGVFACTGKGIRLCTGHTCTGGVSPGEISTSTTADGVVAS